MALFDSNFYQQNPWAARVAGGVGKALSNINQLASPLTGGGIGLTGNLGNQLQSLGGYFSPKPAYASSGYSDPTAMSIPNSSPIQPYSPSSVGVGPSGTPQVPQQSVPQPQPGVPQPDLGVFDQLIGPALQSLEAGIPAANSAYDAAVANTNTQIDKQTGVSQINTANTQNQLVQRQKGAEQTTGNAISEARRGYAEMAQGIQSRYGGATGTGGFAESILGGQTQKNIAGYRQQLAQSIQQIADTQNNVKMVGDQMLQDLESQRQSTIAQHKAQLDNAISQIRARQGELQSRKADLVANAISQYQQAVYQANNLSQQFAQKLAEQQQAAQQRLQIGLTTQQQKVQQLQLVTDRLTGQPMGVFNKGTGSYGTFDQGQTGQSSGYIGQGAQPSTLQGIDTSILTPEEAKKYGIGF